MVVVVDSVVVVVVSVVVVVVVVVVASVLTNLNLSLLAAGFEPRPKLARSSTLNGSCLKIKMLHCEKNVFLICFTLTEGKILA